MVKENEFGANLAGYFFSGDIGEAAGFIKRKSIVEESIQVLESAI